MVRATIETTLAEAKVLPVTPPQIATSQAPRNDGRGRGPGESRGAQPLWQESEGVPQNFFLFPPSFQEGG